MFCVPDGSCLLPPDAGRYGKKSSSAPCAQTVPQKGERPLKRAMTEEAKTARAKEILDTAERLFLESGYRDLKMSHIAKAAGISNGLLFVYFKTKETLFLCLLWREYEKRLDFLEEHVRRRRPESFSDIQNLLLEELTLLLETNPLYIRLEALRAVILERGADTDTLCRMKKRLSERTDAWSRQLEESGVLSREEIMDIYCMESGIITGCYQQSLVSASVQNSLPSTELCMVQRDYRSDILNGMKCYLEGYRRRRNSPDSFSI